jgi:hypothetical protein
MSNIHAASLLKGLLYLLIVLLMPILIISAHIIYQKVNLWFCRVIILLKGLLSVLGVIKGKDAVTLDESLEVAGYAYDPTQDIFFSILNPWQRTFGYCYLYDEAAAPMGMIIDCEPIYFEYEGKKWLIEFWKGQYDLTTGCEVGVYTSEGPDLNIPGIFNGTFYECASFKDLLQISYSLKKNGKRLFIRKGRHWWLTGFRLGEFSEPAELTMYINITLKDRNMRNVFVKGLKNAGYLDNEIAVFRNSVSLIFKKPRTPQPHTRTKATDAIIQRKNKLLCEQYQEITQGYPTIKDKLKAIQEKAPDFYVHITRLGKPIQLFGIFKKISKYLTK